MLFRSVVAGGDVPFAGGIGAVAGGAKSLGEGDALVVEAAAVPGMAKVVHHVADACLMRVKAGEEGSARWATACGVVKLGEPEPVSGKGVEVGRFDLATEATDVREADVVAEDDDDVGPWRGEGREDDARHEGGERNNARDGGHGRRLGIRAVDCKRCDATGSGSGRRRSAAHSWTRATRSGHDVRVIHPWLSDEAFGAAVEALDDAGKMGAWWLGQMGFLVRAGGRRFVMDPYLSDSLTRKYAGTDRPHVRMTGRVVAPGQLRQIDVVTASHGHTDHLDPETLRPLADANPHMLLVCPAAIRSLALERSGLPPGRVIGLDADGDGSVPSVFEGDGWTIHALPAAHETIERDREGRMLCLGFVVRCGGWSWYHAGDTIPWEGMDKRIASHRPDVAFLPINGRRPERRVSGNLWGREAAAISKASGVGTAIPGHFEMFEFNTEPPDEFAVECARLGQGFQVLRAGEGWQASR